MDILNNIYKSPRKPTVVLLVETRFSNIRQVVNNYLKSIVCDKTPFCNQCEMCKKIDNKSYYDLLILDGNKETIKKQNVLTIQDLFNQSAFEKAKKKFYVIYSIENSTIESVNSLLKFMEQPPENTYAILTTRNINKVLPTIRSRCQVYTIIGNENEFKKNITDKFNLQKLEVEAACCAYYNIEELQEDIESKKFELLFKFISSLNSYNVPLSTIKELSQNFRELDYPDIYKIFKFCLALKTNKQEEIINVINTLKYYPIKILLFNKLLDITKRK